MSNTRKEKLPSKAYLQLKTKYKKYIFLYRSGSYYLTYGNDAITVSRLLDVPLTTINDCISMAILPLCSLDECIDILVKQGNKVAMAEEVEKEEIMGANCASQSKMFDI